MWPFDQLFGDGSSSQAAPSDPTSNPTVQAWAQAHGGLVGSPYVIDPTNKNGSTNPNPTYDIAFADGSHMTMDSQGAVKSAVEKGSTKAAVPYDHYYQAADGTEHGIKPDGTDVVINSATKPAAAAKPDTYKYLGGTIYDTSKPDANGAPTAVGTYTTTTSSSGQKVIKNAAGELGTVDGDGNFVPLGGDNPAKASGGSGSTRTAAQEAQSQASADASEAQAEYDKHRSQLADAQTALTQAKLAVQQATSQEQVQQAQANLDKTNQQVQLLQAQVSLDGQKAQLAGAQAGKADAQAGLAGAQAAKALTLAPNTVAPYIPRYNLDTGQIDWVPNQNQQTVSDSILGLYQQTAPLVTGGQISLDQAKSILDAAHGAMQDALTYTDSVGRNAEDMAKNANDMAVGAGTNAYVQSRMNGGNAPAPQPLTQLPYDPATFAANIAAQTLAHISPAAMAHHQAVTAGLPPPDTSGAALGQQVPFQAPSPADNTGSGAANGTAAPQTAQQQPPFQAPTSGSGHTITINIGGSGGSGDGSTPPPGWEGAPMGGVQPPGPPPTQPPQISQSSSSLPTFQAPQ